ncbi:phosphoenolpyruvate hydrolase family protein [Brevibacillus nitrificans]|uniref:phosphoenolpyruvate hydrolase family protein n=1 Tax=Brevibacillus nitrificans TaxID=651560 RepID=UPI002E1BBDC7|nr:phosphoenolpyruvate hydrolase family protein [Brevibacillus nitrificans]
MNPKTNIRKALTDSLQKRKPLIGVATGSGFSAKQAVAGGADLLLVLHASLFRNAGVSSLGSLLPFANSNEMVMQVGTREVLPHAGEVPVVFGVCATDPTIHRPVLIDQIMGEGFQGVNNFPSVGLIDGTVGAMLEEEGFGFQQEVDFLAACAQRGLFTIGFVFTEEQARAMAKADVDVICAHFGWTIGGGTGIKHGMSIPEAVDLANRIFRAAKEINPEALHMVYGGPIVSPEHASHFYLETSAVGVIGGSTFERIPTEERIKGVIGEFKRVGVLAEENRYLKKELMKKMRFDEIVGQSRAMQEIYEIISKVAGKNVNVLVQGESGTGKELIVRSIHYNSNRYKHAFIKVNCASLPEQLLESELFGHEKGSFTGAIQQRIGRFELAHQGTLFLDEIGEMSLVTQAKLLRAIQYREFERVGGNKTIKVDTRIVCATNRDLWKAVQEGRFREDLFYRLNVISIQTIPLRELKEDIPLMVSHFLKKINEKFQGDVTGVTAPALDALLAYDWPGNVRELEHVLERAAVLCEEDRIGIADLPAYIQQAASVAGEAVGEGDFADKPLQTLEKEWILETLRKHAWNRTKAAEALGFTRRTLFNKMKKYGIEPISK